MAIIKKSRREIELMRGAGRLVHEVLEAIRAAVRPGITTGELNDIADEMIRSAGAKALFKGQTMRQAKMPFPSAICASVNEEVVHGIPGARVLREGDIISVDVGVQLDGYCGDSASTIPVGRIDPEVQRLLDVTERTLQIALDETRAGRAWSEVAARMEDYACRARFSVVRDFVGHGIGTELHEDPQVPNFVERRAADGKGRRKRSRLGGVVDRFAKPVDLVLETGLVIAVEPMINMGTEKVKYADELGWTVTTADGRPSAHFEHTLAVTPDGVDVLTDGR